MKKFIVALLLGSMVLSLAACGNTKVEEVVEDVEDGVEDVVEDVVDDVEEVVEDVVEDVEEDVEDEAEDVIEGLTAAMPYEAYAAAEVDSFVTVLTYVQATQGWWEKDGQGVITAYTQDADGAYFLYNMACSEEDAAKLVPGTPIFVQGYKSEWSGEVEIVDAEFTFVEGIEPVVFDATDVTDLMGKDELADKMNQFVSFKEVTVAPYNEAGDAFNYNWNGNGSHDDNSDLYFNVEKDGATYTFTVESYLCGNDSDVYATVENLAVGDVIDVEGFLYWYEGAQTHVTNVKVCN